MRRPSWLKAQITYGEIFTLVVFIVGVIVGYVRLDAKVDLNDSVTRTRFDKTDVYNQTRFAFIDKQLEDQKQVDKDQNERQIRTYNELKAALSLAQSEIKSDIKDIRTDIAVRGMQRR